MLPDFLNLKIELLKKQTYSVTRDYSDEPLLSRIAAHVNHEGNGFDIIREDGTQDSSDYVHATADLSLELKDVQEKGEIAIDEAINAATEQIRNSGRKMLFDTLNRTVPATDAKGRPFSAELMLEVWESMDFSFDEQGNWQQPVLVFNPIREDRVKQQLTRFDEEPELRRLRDEIIERKRTVWDDREANRKLVD